MNALQPQIRHAELSAEYKQQKAKKEEIEERLARLASATGSSCPLCGQSLTESHRQEMRTELESELARLEKQLGAITAEGTAVKE